MLAGWASLCLAAFAHGGAVPDDEVAAWVAKRVEERQPSARDRRFDKVGWARDLRTAIRLGKEHGRPIFLFTMDGRINTGRC